MFGRLYPQQSYQKVEQKDELQECDAPQGSEKRRRTLLISFLGLGLLGLTTLVFVALSIAGVEKPHDQQPLCSKPSIRREWRTLTDSEKRGYITAVQCLQSTPSQMKVNASRFDDYPWIHQNVGKITHESAQFFPWHRYLLHVQQRDLLQHCGYEGTLPYWDWTIDWEDPARSPLFSPTSGFGGNGNTSGSTALTNGYCVAEGPFSGLQLQFWGAARRPHCLSRRFNETVFGRRHIKPEIMRSNLALDDYMEFLIAIEHYSHNTIPIAIGGDFASFMAPGDPLFFLHHGQIDRLWWIWQQQDPKRQRLYTGPSTSVSNASADVEDILGMGGLSPDVMVSEVMNTESAMLCYRYDTHKIG